MKTIALQLAALGLFGLTSTAAIAGPEICPVVKCSGGSFCIKSSPSECPKSIMIHEPIYAILECYPNPGGALCVAWPQEYGSVGNLTYEWQTRVGLVQTVHPPGTSPVISLLCQVTQPVTATVTVRNGSYSSTRIVGFTCGDEVQ